MRIVTGDQVDQVGQVAQLQVRVLDESRADVAVHGFWKWGTSALFDMQIINLDARSYLR